MTAATGVAVSVLARLARHAREIEVDPNLVLARFAAERLLYRLARSPHAERFVLKGALLMLVWLGETIRPTRDADLLGFGEVSAASLRAIFSEVCATPVETDGMEYAAATIRVATIRLQDAYGGFRVKIEGRLGKARLPVQVDVGIGDAVTPAPEWLDYPALLDLPRPRLRAYRPETAIAEKLHAMVVLGEANSRMRDFFDVDALSRGLGFHLGGLGAAVRATFARRHTPLPAAIPVALTPTFAALTGKGDQWRGFLRKSSLDPRHNDLAAVVGRLSVFLAPVIAVARDNEAPALTWPPGGPWRDEI